MIKIIFFDFDGTIVDSKNLAVDCLIKVLKKRGLEIGRKRALKFLGMKIQGVLKTFGFLGADKITKEFFKEMTAGVDRLKFCVSIAPLKKFKRKYKMIIVSNSHSVFIKACLKKFKIEKLFDCFYGADRFSTKEEILKKLFKKFKIKPRESIYIGDRFSDVECAKKAGCWAVALHNKCSWSTKSEIMKQKPDFVVGDFRRLGKVLEKLKNKKD